MMAEYRELTLTLHGLDEYNQAVDGEVFARKFAAFMRGIGKSDAAANDGSRRHRFLISDLKKNTATAVVREQVIKAGPSPASGISYYVDSVSRVYEGRAQSQPRKLISDIASLTKGAGRTFSFAEVKGERIDPKEPASVIRIDEFLENRARRALEESISIERGRAPATYFEGTAFGSYDGILKAVDLRGDMKKAVLLLSAGGKSIECIVNTIAVTELGDALDQRVVAYGVAHYEKTSGLPVRVDIRKLEVVRNGLGIGRWRGAFDIPPDAHDRSGWDGP